MNTKNPDDKTKLRSYILAQRKEFFQNTSAYEEASLKAQKSLISSEAWTRATSVALYVPIRGETDTSLLAETARTQGKTLFYPRCTHDESGERNLEFVICNDVSSLERGTYGIMEPRKCLSATNAVPDILVVPAVALDSQGYRLGYGGGYYDRLLARPQWQGTYTSGLIFSFQLVNTLPCQAWDKPLRSIATEKGLICL